MVDRVVEISSKIYEQMEVVRLFTVKVSLGVL
jgi:hypothetical protein